MKKSFDPPSFSLEEALNELQKLVERLETGRDDIETSFSLYQEAEKISLHAQKRLSSYEEKLRIIQQTSQKDSLSPSKDPRTSS